MKTAILHQGFIPHYRVRFFELLNAHPGAEYVVFHGNPPSGLGHEAATGPFNFPNVRVQNHEVVLGSRSLTYQPVLRAIWSGDYDAVVLGTHVQFLSNHAVFLLSRIENRAVLYWGHGYERVVDEREHHTADHARLDGLMRSLAAAGVRLKRAASKLPDGYLVYTEGGARELRTNGVDPERITVVRNTMDMAEEVQLHEQTRLLDERVVRSQLGLDPDAVVLLFVGRIYPAKHVESLIDAARKLDGRTTRPFQLVLIGDGPTAPAVRARAQGLDNVIFTGAIYEPERVARYLRVATAVVSVGLVGLIANHALAHGLPLITQVGNMHSPEIEYLTSGQDALIANDFDEFVSFLAQIVDSRQLAKELGDSALRTREKLSLQTMVSAFHAGVERAVFS